MVQLALMPAMISSREEKSTTFLDNMKLPIHRWFRFSAGYSAQWVEQEIAQHLKQTDEPVVLLDPFAGVGTTLLAGDICGVRSYGIEAQPFLGRVARAKLYWAASANEFNKFAHSIYRLARQKKGSIEGYPQLIRKCFPDDTLLVLDALRSTWLEHDDGSPFSELVWLAVTAILRISSPVGTAQMELIQPRKSKKNFLHPFQALEAQIRLMFEDMLLFQSRAVTASTCTTLYRGDARTCAGIPDRSVNLVITSPPYANNFDYADATRFEMSFWGQVQKWSDLHEIRRDLIVSCSHHARALEINSEEVLSSPELAPLREEITSVYSALAKERLSRGGKKNYHLMAVGYFFDMAQVWQALRRVCAENVQICFAIGDSAPYGVHVPVDRWLGELALAAGFARYHFEKTRDRNIKWENRKHRVPLHEGLLWVKG